MQIVAPDNVFLPQKAGIPRVSGGVFKRWEQATNNSGKIDGAGAAAIHLRQAILRAASIEKIARATTIH